LAPEELTSRDGVTDLIVRQRITESVIIDWYFERAPGAVLLEELHTACELLLEYLVNQRSKRLSFAELVQAADGEGLLDWPVPENIRELVGAPAAGRELLLTLKDFRKEARHRTGREFDPWLRENWEAVVLMIERLAAQAGRQARMAATAQSN
jgi:hypothetical protein